MKISTNGKRNITLDFNAPKNFRIVQNGVEIPYLRTGKNSFRLSKKVDGDIEMEEVKEKAKRIKPFSLQSPQMTFISSDDVDRLNSAIEQMALVNPQDVAAINNAAEKIDSSQMYIAEKQQQLETTQTYIDQQQQRLNETALGIRALETDNSQRLDGAENAILNLAGEVSNAQNMAVDGMNTALNKIEEQGILLQAEIDTKADKDELESLKKDFEEKSDQFSNAMASYSGGYAYDTLPRDGEAGQILAKRTDRQGDYIWIDQTPVIVKSETMPTASEKYKDAVYQYVGETGDYTHGYIYECQQNGTSYEWVRLDVQPNTGVWGQITGTLSDQTDLQNALNLKANKSYVDSQDNNLQQQIDAITAASDVTDIVGTYAQLQAYDTSALPNNSIIKVLQDESRNDETTYYRWVITGGVGAWVLIGEEGPYYTKSENNALLSAKQDTLVSGTNIKTVNGASLLGSGNLTTSAQWGSISGTLSNQTDLQNALNAKQDEATAVNYDNITNCITEIPQDIKLELNNGTLILKAGSKVYVPNGAGVFDVVTVASDIAMNGGLANGSELVYLVANGSSLYHYLDNSSGTNWTATSQYQCRYNTNDNMIKNTNDTGSTWLSQLSFPIARVKLSSGTVTSIDQVFNGFGYIGSTVFALPGVKGLTPNGRNADGTLKSIEFTIDTVKTFNNTIIRNNSNLTINQNANISPQNVLSYDSEKNLNISNNSVVMTCKYATWNADSTGKITSLTPKTAFHAVDYNDYQALSNRVDTNTSNIALKQDIATAVNYDNITNCITEIPQDIKLELNNGTLTLKAGSKVYVPNGAGKFDVVSVSSDITLTSLQNRTGLLYYASGSIYTEEVGRSYSGSSYTGGTYGLWYDTTNNKIGWTSNGGSTFSYNLSLPLAIITVTTSGVTSIDQVFNGFGYIGSTAFALPGVKGLIPNGRNEDGSLKSIECAINKVYLLNLTNQSIKNADLFFTPNGMAVANVTYDEENNTNSPAYVLVCGKFSSYSGRVTSITPKTAFHAVDYNDFNNTPHIVETYKNGASWYRVWSDGWIEQGGEFNSGNSITFLKPFVYKPTFLRANFSRASSDNFNQNTACSFFGQYSNLSTTQITGLNTFNGSLWYACGY